MIATARLTAATERLAMADQVNSRPRFCAQCGERLCVNDAKFCKECGAPLAASTWLEQELSWRPLVALILSVIPGLGQLYKGHPWRALLWFGGVSLMYSVAPPFGFLLHIICAANAALSGSVRETAFTRGRSGFSPSGPRA
jgi:hypothetical protein